MYAYRCPLQTEQFDMAAIDFMTILVPFNRSSKYYGKVTCSFVLVYNLISCDSCRRVANKLSRTSSEAVKADGKKRTAIRNVTKFAPSFQNTGKFQFKSSRFLERAFIAVRRSSPTSTRDAPCAILLRV